MPNLSGRLASIIVAACLLTGCQPPAPTPSPLPSYRCTPEAGGAEFDCSQKQYDDMVAKEKLYAEAEAVYRKFLAEDARILRAGGVSEPTPVLIETTSGDYLANVLANYRTIQQRGVTAKGPDPGLVFFRRAPGRSKTGSDVSATTCVDGTSLMFSREGKTLGPGKVARDDTYFARVGGAMKIIGADGSQVASCD